MKKRIFEGINPEKVMYFFEEISQIPRGSGKTAKISEYCENFAKERSLKYIRDEVGNVVIFKNGSAGKENNEPVILQGHLDMVWEKTSDCPINFEVDPLSLKVDGDYISADGTTLGGDDGIAVAMCLALLDGEYEHPPIEAVFTIDEETGMDGAFALDTSVLNGKKMINIDSEDEGTLWVSCAGGARVYISLPVKTVSSQGSACEIVISGLHGGHSGAEIHMGYANANMLMGRILNELSKCVDFNIASINGGTMDNAITRDCRCSIDLISDSESLFKSINRISSEIKKEFASTDPDMSIKVTESEKAKEVFDKKSTNSVISILCKFPYGVMAMSKEIEGLVETSLNLGVMKTETDSVNFSFSVRSSVDGERKKLVEKLKSIADECSAEFETGGEYPAWEYKRDSEMQKIMADVYFEEFGKKMTITAIHAGLECGLFCGKISGLDCVSFGPDIYDIHTPQERLSISSCERMWKYLLAVLKKL